MRSVGPASTAFAAPWAAAGAYPWFDEHRVSSQFDAAGVTPSRPCPRRCGLATAEAVRKGGSS